MRQDHPDIDVLFVTGDVVAHAVPLEAPPKHDFSTSSYEHVLEILSIFAGLLNEYFPNAVMLPV